MKVVYYTYPAFFDASICLIQALSKKVDLHVILEISPDSYTSPLFDLKNIPLIAGIIAAGPILRSILPEKAHPFFENLEGFYLSVSYQKRSIHYETIWQGMRVSRLVDKIKPDLVYFEDISLRMALNSFWLKKYPWVMGVHDSRPHSGEENWRQSLSRKLTLGRNTPFIFHSKHQQDVFIEDHPELAPQTNVIPLGPYNIYKAWAEDSKPQPGRNILFLGRLSHYKGLEVLLDAMKLVCAQLENVTLTIAGRAVEGYYPPKTPQLSNNGKIIFLEKYITPTDLAAYFTGTTCVVCPYIDATQSGVALTAYAFEKPVIATRTGGLPEYVFHEQTGLLVRPNDPSELAMAIIQILENAGLHRRLRDGLISLSQGPLLWDNICTQYIDIFNRTIYK